MLQAYGAIKNPFQIVKEQYINNVQNNRSQLLITQRQHSIIISSIVENKQKHKLYISKGNKVYEMNTNNFTNEQKLLLGQHQDDITTMCISQNSKYLFSGGKDKKICIWDIKDQNKITDKLEGHKETITTMCISNKDNYLYSGGFENDIYIWDLQQKKILLLLEGHNNKINTLITLKDGSRLYSSSNDKQIIIWSLQEYKILKTFNNHDGFVRDIILSNNQRYLYASVYKDIVIWDLDKNQQIKKIQAHQEIISSIQLSKDGNILYTGSKDQQIKIWDLNTFQQIGEFNQHQSPINILLLSNDENILYSVDINKYLYKWNLSQNRIKQKIQSEIDNVKSLCISQQNNILYYTGINDKIYQWNIQNKQSQLPLDAKENYINCICLSHDELYLYSAGQGNKINIWNLQQNQIESVLEDTSSQTIYSLFYLKDGLQNYFNNFVNDTLKSGHLLFTAGTGKQIIVWNLNTNQIIHKINRSQYNDSNEDSINQSNNIKCMCFSSQTHLICFAGKDTFIYLYDLSKKNQTQGLIGHKDTINDMCISKDGYTLYSASNDQRILIWDLIQIQQIGQLQGHQDSVQTLSIQFKENILYSAGYDKKILIWDLQNKQKIGSLEGHRGDINKIYISQNDHSLYSVGEYNEIFQWQIISINFFEDFFIQQNFNQFEEDKIFKYLQFLKSIYQKNYLPQILNFILYFCIEMHFEQSLEFLMKNNMVYWQNKITTKSPLQFAIEKKNSIIINKLFDFLSSSDNIRLLTNNDFKFLLKNKYQQIDNFLSKTILQISKYGINNLQIQKLTSLKTIQKIYKKNYCFDNIDYKYMIRQKFSDRQEKKPIDNRQFLKQQQCKQQFRILNKINDKNYKFKQDLEFELDNTQLTSFYMVPITFNFKARSEDFQLFLNRYASSESQDFIASPYQFLIKYQWLKLKKYYIILACIFWLFQILFSINLLINSVIFFTICCILISVLFVYEILSFIKLGNEYQMDKTNFLDILIFITSLLTLIIVQFLGTKFNSTVISFIKIITIFLIYLRGFIYLKAFKQFRHLINMVINVTLSSITVIILMVYIILGISIMFTQTKLDFVFGKSLEYTFGSIFGNFPEEDEDLQYESSIWLVMIIAAIILPIIIINFLIAKMSNKYTELEEQQIYIKLQEQAKIVLELNAFRSLFKKTPQKSIEDNRLYLFLAVPQFNNERTNLLNKLKSDSQRKIQKIEQKKLIDMIPNIQNQIQQNSKQNKKNNQELKKILLDQNNIIQTLLQKIENQNKKIIKLENRNNYQYNQLYNYQNQISLLILIYINNKKFFFNIKFYNFKTYIIFFQSSLKNEQLNLILKNYQKTIMQIKLLILLITLKQTHSLCMSCIFSRKKPVCGNDGQTYTNECEAVCQGIVIVSQGECVVQNDPNICVCSKEESWVCGQDGNNYKNLCLMKCSGIELASEGLCEDKTKICEQGCNNSAVSVEMLLSETINGSNTVPNFCTAFCNDNIPIEKLISVAGINDNYDFISEKDSNDQFCQEFPQITCDDCTSNQSKCPQCDTCVENGNTENNGCKNHCRNCTNCQFQNRCIDNSARSNCFREVKRDSQDVLSLAQCGCPDFENPQCGQNKTTQYRNTCHLLCNFDKSSGSICPGGDGDTTGEICSDKNKQNNNNNGQNNNNNNGQNNNNNGQNNNNNGQNNNNISDFQAWLQNQYLQNKQQYLGITLNHN